MSASNDYSKYKVAAIQASPVLKDAPEWFDLAATLDKATSLIAEAGNNGAKLIVFPECWLPCYPYWTMDVNDRAGFSEIWANYLWNSIEVPSHETDVLCKAAKAAGAYVTMGINERDSLYPGRMYNSILYIGPDGEILGTHRKICITSSERLFQVPGDGGDNLKMVFDTPLGKLGGSICGEHLQLTLMHNWIMQGVQIHCSLWPGYAGVGDLTTRALCLYGHLFAVSSATYISEKDAPKNFYKNSFFNIPGFIRGGSGIVGPTGKWIAGPVYDEETIVYGDIDLSECDKARSIINLTGLYSRWDLLNLNVSQEAYEPLKPVQVNSQALSDVTEGQIKRLEERISQLERLTQSLPKDEGAPEE
ncbi:MAG: carbon-nitrogen hydrolase family protein [Chloroflexi bacterium]|nr:carbon-nitrogen hydrolase family protein [Chloroflexota bacterium]